MKLPTNSFKSITLFKVPVYLLMMIQYAIGGEISFEKDINWVSNRDLTWDQFEEKKNSYNNSGYIMTGIDHYLSREGVRYSLVCKQNTDNRLWAAHTMIGNNDYEGLVKLYRLQGFRLADFGICVVNGRPQYAVLFIKNTENYDWITQSNQTFPQYIRSRDSLKELGFSLTDFEVYNIGGDSRYASIWIKNNQTEWIQELGHSRSSYMQRIIFLTNRGYILTNYETSKYNGRNTYHFVVQKRSGLGFAVKTNLTALEFANYWRRYRDIGLRLIEFDCSGEPNALKYSGSWIECDNRYRYGKKLQIDSIITKYQIDNNHIPGISAVIIQNGEIIYQRGFGYADKSQKKEAHAETIYSAASTSKVFGGTLATLLHDKKALRNGKMIDFNLFKSTQSYLTDVMDNNNLVHTLPASHTHSVVELCAHRTCLTNYYSDPKGPNVLKKQYLNAIDVLPQIWNTRSTFLNNCDTNIQHYSTYAYTYLAGVIESVSNRRISELLQDEIAIPYGLKSLRALFETETIPEDYERSAYYNDNNNSFEYENNSWKVLGGGIEISAKDLAKFGSLLINGKIVNESVRDSLMWQQMNINCIDCSYGIGWNLSNGVFGKVAFHDGSWDGARSTIRIYRDRNLVISIMSNKSGHNIIELSGSIARIVFN